MIFATTWRVTGEPAERRTTMPFLPDRDPLAPEYEAWYVDTRRAAVAACWRDGTLWLGGSAMYAVGEGVETLASAAQGPAGVADGTVRGWARVAPTPGMRYVVTTCAGTTRDESARIITRRSAADTSRATGVHESPGALAEALILAQLAVAGHARPEAAVLVIEVTASEPADGLVGWLDTLRARGIDLSWHGNEAGPGLLDTFTRARRPGQDVHGALLEQARDDAAVREQIAEHANIWLEELGAAAPLDGQLLPGEPQRGYWRAVELGQLAAGSGGIAGTWIDPGTANARLAHEHHLPGASVVEQLRAYVDEPAAVCIASQSDPDAAVLAFHLVGGLDRSSGEVVGFVLTRIWT